MTQAEWRYTFPIEKAETRDGGLFITGLASGPEVDATAERMHEDLIVKFADQINRGGLRTKEDRLVYRDAHFPDGVMRDLGWLNKAWVNERGQLGVEVELDNENPAAVYLFKQITVRKKKYGMSVAGDVFDYADEFIADIGKMVRTFKDVVLKEISNTTRPAWTPSFGSVISKAIDDAVKADSAPVGVDQVSEQDKELHQHVDEPAGGNADVPAPDVDNDSDKGEDVSTETVDAPETPDVPDPVVEKAGKKVSNATRAKLLDQFEAFRTTLQELGVLEGETETAEKANSEDQPVTPDESKADEPDPLIKALQDQIEELKKSQTELNAQLAVALNRPITQVPAVLEKNVREEVDEVFKGLSPSERLRASLAMQTQGR